jgi:hypothetical protein
VAKAGGGQRALAVGFDEHGQLYARVCAGEPCTLEGAAGIPVPEDAASRAGAAQLRVARLGLERKAVVVEIPNVGGRTWVAVVVAPLAGSVALTPFIGYTGLVEGVEGERTGPAVVVRDEGVYVGIQREGQDLCGRPAILAPQALDPATLTLKAAKVQRLSASEMDGAPVLTAVKSEAAPSPSLLSAQWATSAAPDEPVSALTDGNPTTAWAENRGGAGRGEFAVLRAPREVPIAAFELTLPPPTRAVPHGTSPRQLFVATDHDVFRVTLPSAPKTTPARAVTPPPSTPLPSTPPPSTPGATPLGAASPAISATPVSSTAAVERYDVTLPTAIRTGCVAVVLDTPAVDHRDASVGIAEVTARPASGVGIDDAIRALAGGGPESETAGAMLRAMGPDAFVKLAAAFPTLDEGARRVALDVLDDAPCEIALPAYIDARLGPYEAHARHASAAFARCETETAKALAAALPNQQKPELRIALADELVQVSPTVAVSAIVPLFDTAKLKERRAYRALIGGAAENDAARAAVAGELTRPMISERALLELMRALGPALPSFGAAASRAFARLATPKASFRTRYLLVGPATELAASDAQALAYVKASLVSESRPEVRAEAARSVRDPSAVHSELTRAVADREVRVREAATLALGASHAKEAVPALVDRLKKDEWPLVRSAAARGLSDVGTSTAVDADLATAVDEDESVPVRRAAVRALGLRGAVAQAKRVHSRLVDDVEDTSIRAEAALALGRLCDVESTDVLTDYARKLVDPKATEEQRIIGRNALSGLSLIGPPDLDGRLAPLRDKSMPTVVHELVESALRERGRCAVSGRATQAVPVATGAPGVARQNKK